MARLQPIRWALLMVGLSLFAAAQDNSAQRTAPAPAYGQQDAPILNPDNPPVSGLDEPGLELKSPTRSFFSPSLQISETVDTNQNNQLTTSEARSVSHLMGALDLQQFWPKSDLIVEYLGGVAFNSSPYDVRQLQAIGMEAITRWRTGNLKLRDSFSYVPDGSFHAGTAGGRPGLGIALGGLGTGEGVPGLAHFGNGTLGAVGTIPRLANTAVIDVVQAITPKSAFTVAGGFSNAHFFDDTHSLLDSDQTTIEGGYSRIIGRHDQLAGIYGFQLFRFPFRSGGEIFNHVANVRWSHHITGRMKLIVGLGPQYSEVHLGDIRSHWSLSGRATLRYQFRHTSIVMGWEKYTSQGSGFFSGADTQVARFALRRPIGRTLELQSYLAYSHNRRLQSEGGVTANSYDEGSAGCIVRKHLGRTYDLFVAYRFGEVGFSDTVCINGAGCGKTNQRHGGTVGLEWHPRPTRIE